MNYAQFKRVPDLTYKLLAQVGILFRSTYVFEISHHPDYDLSRYEGPATANYFFSDPVDFPSNMDVVVDVEIKKNEILHYDDIARIAEENGVSADAAEDAAAMLTTLANKGRDIEGWGTEISGFELRDIKKPTIDNLEKTLTFSGGFKGDSFSISHYDWSVYSICNMLGFRGGNGKVRFYLTLITEGYSLLVRGYYALAFFIFYSSYECFINLKLDTEHQPIRLGEKANKLFRTEFVGIDLQKHEIYSSIVNEFRNYTKIRDAIAHGNAKSVATERDARDLLRFVLIVMVSIETKTESFAALKDLLSAHNFKPFSSD